MGFGNHIVSRSLKKTEFLRYSQFGWLQFTFDNCLFVKFDRTLRSSYWCSVSGFRSFCPCHFVCYTCWFGALSFLNLQSVLVNLKSYNPVDAISNRRMAFISLKKYVGNELLTASVLLNENKRYDCAVVLSLEWKNVVWIPWTWPSTKQHSVTWPISVSLIKMW